MLPDCSHRETKLLVPQLPYKTFCVLAALNCFGWSCGESTAYGAVERCRGRSRFSLFNSHYYRKKLKELTIGLYGSDSTNDMGPIQRTVWVRFNERLHPIRWISCVPFSTIQNPATCLREIGGGLCLNRIPSWSIDSSTLAVGYTAKTCLRLYRNFWRKSRKSLNSDPN